jgi:pimeloyl-ACP methyl ester carboxylesterase
MTEIFFFHGKESGPHGSKYEQLVAAGYTVISPDFSDMELPERLAKAEAETAGRRDLIVVGSSMGGLVAALLYNAHPERFKSYLLLAPALHWAEAEAIDKVPATGKIIHGSKDTEVPLAASQAFADKFQLALEVVEDNHRLGDSHQQMLAALAQLVSDTAA